jgi:hypothetical protein
MIALHDAAPPFGQASVFNLPIGCLYVNHLLEYLQRLKSGKNANRGDAGIPKPNWL